MKAPGLKKYLKAQLARCKRELREVQARIKRMKVERESLKNICGDQGDITGDEVYGNYVVGQIAILERLLESAWV